MASGAARGPGRRAVALAVLGVLASGAAAGGRAHAQIGVSPPLLTGPVPAVDEEGLPPEPVARPRLSLAVGMGASLDASGFTNGAHAIPAFFGVGGFGDGLLGVDLGAFSSAASGRFHSGDDAPVDRLALDGFAVIRPAARVRPDDTRYRLRVLRTLAAEVGLGFERDGHTTASGTRLQIHTGARVELPLTAADRLSELRLRLAVRHAVGLYTPEVSGGQGANAITRVGDSTELYAALAVVF